MLICFLSKVQCNLIYFEIMLAYAYLVAAFFCNATASIFLKVGATQMTLLHTPNIRELIGQYRFLIIGASLFAITLIFYILAIRTIPITVAYPILTGASFLFVNILAVFFLKEHIQIIGMIGMFCILIGIILVTFSAQQT